MRVWRICLKKFAASSFSGEGARLYEGRWNPAGVPMVYTATSLALVSVEFLVHLDPGLAPDDLVSSSATIPGTVKSERLDIAALPRDWHRLDHSALRQIGADWITSNRSAALQVPSAAVDGEWNVLLNPRHPQLKRIKLEPSLPFTFDERMFRR